MPDGTIPEDDVPRTLAGRYELRERLDSGGPDEPWRARDHQRNMEVSVRLRLPPSGVGPAAWDALLDSFAVRARRFAELTNPALVPPDDHGTAASPAGTAAYLVQRALVGSTLRRVLVLHGQRPVPEALGLAEQLCRAASVVHAAGTVHGDISPDSVVLEDDRVRLLGPLPPQPAVDTSSAQRPMDRTDDLYAIGAILHELLSGQPLSGPTTAASDGGTGHGRAGPVRLVQLRDDITPEIENLVEALMAQDPAARPTADVAADRLAELGTRPIPWLGRVPLGKQLGLAAPRRTPEGGYATGAPVVPESEPPKISLEKASPPRPGLLARLRKRPRTVTAVAIGAAIVAAAGTVTAVVWDDRPEYVIALRDGGAGLQAREAALEQAVQQVEESEELPFRLAVETVAVDEGGDAVAAADDVLRDRSGLVAILGTPTRLDDPPAPLLTTCAWGAQPEEHDAHFAAAPTWQDHAVATADLLDEEGSESVFVAAGTPAESILLQELAIRDIQVLTEGGTDPITRHVEERSEEAIDLIEQHGADAVVVGAPSIQEVIDDSGFDGQRIALGGREAGCTARAGVGMLEEVRDGWIATRGYADLPLDGDRSPDGRASSALGEEASAGDYAVETHDLATAISETVIRLFAEHGEPDAADAMPRWVGRELDDITVDGIAGPVSFGPEGELDSPEVRFDRRVDGGWEALQP